MVFHRRKGNEKRKETKKQKKIKSKKQNEEEEEDEEMENRLSLSSTWGRGGREGAGLDLGGGWGGWVGGRFKGGAE